MINFPERTFRRVNRDASRVEVTYVWEGVSFPHDRSYSVDRPFRELFDFISDSGEKMADENALAMSESILELARDVYCPIDTGDLRESASLEWSDNEESYMVSFNTRYALYVHEDLTAWHEPPTCAKYLDKAVAEVSQMFEQSGSFNQVGQDIDGFYISGHSTWKRKFRNTGGGGVFGNSPNFGQSEGGLGSIPKPPKFTSLRKRARYNRLRRR